MDILRTSTNMTAQSCWMRRVGRRVGVVCGRRVGVVWVSCGRRVGVVWASCGELRRMLRRPEAVAQLYMDKERSVRGLCTGLCSLSDLLHSSRRAKFHIEHEMQHQSPPLNCPVSTSICSRSLRLCAIEKCCRFILVTHKKGQVPIYILGIGQDPGGLILCTFSKRIL